MQYLHLFGLAAAFFLNIVLVPVFADDAGAGGGRVMRADAHAPIGVMREHTHKRGEWMFAYRYGFMHMQGNRRGENNLSADTIATTIPNRFSGRPGQPPTLRVVPDEMSMEMHMFGAMYAPLDALTLMLGSSYVEKSMDHTTYLGGAGTAVRGHFTTKSDGLGDTRASAMWRVYSHANHRAQINFGASLPTGSTSERAMILTPTGTTPRARLPYAMQIGSGTFDVLPGFTYTGRQNQFGWGGQYAGTVRTGSDNGYTLGDLHELSAWLSYQPISALSFSGRVQYQTTGRIAGADPQISGPVQTADPDNYGGDVVNLLLGANWAGQNDWMRGKRLGFEVGVPLLRDLDGVQLETDVTLTVGLQVAF